MKLFVPICGEVVVQYDGVSMTWGVAQSCLGGAEVVKQCPYRGGGVCCGRTSRFGFTFAATYVLVVVRFATALTCVSIRWARVSPDFWWCVLTVSACAAVVAWCGWFGGFRWTFGVDYEWLQFLVSEVVIS